MGQPLFPSGSLGDTNGEDEHKILKATCRKGFTAQEHSLTWKKKQIMLHLFWKLNDKRDHCHLTERNEISNVTSRNVCGDARIFWNTYLTHSGCPQLRHSSACQVRWRYGQASNTPTTWILLDMQVRCIQAMDLKLKINICLFLSDFTHTAAENLSNWQICFLMTSFH